MSTRTLARFARRHSPLHPRAQLLGDPNRRLLQPPAANPVDVIAAPVPGVLPDASTASVAAASLIHQANITLDAAAINGLPTAYVDVTGDPSADQLLVVVLATLHLHWVQDHDAIEGNAIVYLSLDNGNTFTTSLVEAVDGSVTSLLANGEDAASVFANDSVIDATRGMLARNILAQEFGRNITLGAFNAGNNFTLGVGNTLDLSALFYVFDRSVGRFLTTDESSWDPDARTFA